jgi:hypothetical protein
LAPSRPRPAPGATRARGDDRDCRCACGSLVARIVSAGVELRCRRCKRTLLVPWSARDGSVAPHEVCADLPATAAREASVGSAA